jgi:pSer/pThr/pTyr-binding forkhead associated (FHA) protein
MLCHSCHHQNIFGAIFCLHCGMSMLPQDRKRDTTAMLGSRPSAKLVSSTASTGASSDQASERRFRATIINNGRHINLPLAVPVLIGRQDSARGFFPDLDLNNDGGYDSGVSRKHARISVNGEVAYVEDLESANGTFINDQRLQPRSPHRLKASDELRLGSLILRVEHI